MKNLFRSALAAVLLLGGVAFAGVPGSDIYSSSSSTPPPAATAVNFDGATFLARGGQLTGISDSATGILSVWVKSSGLNASALFTDDTDNFSIFSDASALQWSLFGLSNANKIFGDWNAGSTDDGVWHHYLVSWNTNFPAGSRIVNVYLDDVQDTSSTFTDAGVAFNVGYSASGDWSLGSDFFGSIITGDVAEFYFAPGQFLDFTVAANRRKFVSASIHPVSLGSTCATPTGTAPLACFSGGHTTFATNKGTGGAFTVTGTLTDASTNP